MIFGVDLLYIMARAVGTPCLEGNGKVIGNASRFMVLFSTTLRAVIGKPLPVTFFVTASCVPFLTLVAATVVPAVFDPACVLTIDVSIFIAFLELTLTVLPVALILACKGVFNLLGDVFSLKFLKFVPGVESPGATIGVCCSAFIRENDVFGEVTIAPYITCLNNKAVHLNTIFQNGESVKIINFNSGGAPFGSRSVDSVLINIAVIAGNLSILNTLGLLPEESIVNDIGATIVKWMFPSKLNHTSVLVVVSIIADWCTWLVVGSVLSNI